MDGQLPGPLSSFAVIVGEKEKKKNIEENKMYITFGLGDK